MDYTDFIVKQQGRDLTLLDSSKIVINKYDNKVTRIVFEFDETIPGRYYFAMKNPVTGKYRILPIINNHMVIGTNISSYPGTWSSILIVVDDQSEIINDDIDETQFTFISNPFSRIVVRNNFLNEEDIEEDEELHPIINEILDNLVKAQDRLENAAIAATEAAASARADRETVSQLIDNINEINTSVDELHGYITEIQNIKNEIQYDTQYVKDTLTLISNKVKAIEEMSQQVTADKNYISNTVGTFSTFIESVRTELLNAYNNYIKNIASEGEKILTNIEEARNEVEEISSEVSNLKDNALIEITTQQASSVKDINAVKESAINAINSAHTSGVQDIEARKSSALLSIETVNEEIIADINSAKDLAVEEITTGKDEYVELITAEKSTAITAIRDSVQNVANEVASVKDNAIQGVLDESENQQNLIAAKVQEALDSIPDEYEEVYRIAREGAEKADAITCKAFGETIVTQDSSDDFLRGLKLFGKTEQETTTGKNLLYCSFAKSDVDSLIIPITVEAGNYKFTMFNPDGTTTGLVEGDTYVAHFIDEEAKQTASYVQNGVTITAEQASEITQIKVIYEGNKYTGSYNTVYGQLEKGLVKTEYEPYTNGKPSPSLEHPQPLNSVGKMGNLLDDSVNKGYVVTKSYANAMTGKLLSGFVYTDVVFTDGTKANNSGCSLDFELTDGNIAHMNVGNTTKITDDISNLATGNVTLYFNDLYVGKTIDYIMINEGTTALPYRPYTGQKEIGSEFYGGNFIPQPYRENSKTVSGVTFDVKKDYSVDVSGTNTEGLNFYFANNHTLKKGTYTLSGMKNATGPILRIYDEINRIILADLSGQQNHVSFTTTEDKKVSIFLNKSTAGTTFSGTVYPMLNYGTEPLSYSQYTKQSHISLVSDGLKGIPLGSTIPDVIKNSPVHMDGVYWDAETEQYYIGDTTGDENVQRVGTLIEDGTKQFTYSENEKIYKKNLYVGQIGYICLCTMFTTAKKYSEIANLDECIAFSDSRIILKTNKFKSVEGLNAFFAENPMEIQYVLAEPITTPLTASEIESFSSLRSNYSTTTVMNDCNVFSELSYNADTAIFVKNNTPLPSEESINAAVNDYLDKNPVSMVETDPTVPAWAKQPNKPSYTATEVGADPSGTATLAVSTHNVSTEAHNDIRIFLAELREQVTTVLNSDDETLDQMNEVVAYIKANRELIESVTTVKVSVDDIIDNLTTNINTKVLSASQGVVLKRLIDDLQIALNDKAPMTHSHDNAYYLKPEVDNLIANQSGIQIITWEDDD